ncbi:hypothetical protein JVT61DRAFT_12350 [Boletus reticuloceps]|uniref:Uncharacterized protein n=1 Tax=Boletus reticuloceps TaxID=495285 RepID=A0A8I3A3M6_9AGAM|nr:hypothetical protein JVT61DRAFT_12350 [Boletus reticuloceps]
MVSPPFLVDTRIRENGLTLAKLLARRSQAPRGPMRSLLPVSQPVSRASSPSASLSRREDYLDIPFHDPNQDNLVAVVSLTSPRIFQPTTKPRLHPSGRTLRIIAISIIRYGV